MNIADAHNYLEVFWYQSFTNETAVEWIFFSAMIANSSLTLTLGKDACRYGRNIGFLFLQHRGRPTPINLCKTWWKYISRHFKTNSMVKFYTCNPPLRSKLSKYRIMPYVINLSNFVFYILVLIILHCTCIQKTKKILIFKIRRVKIVELPNTLFEIVVRIQNLQLVKKWPCQLNDNFLNNSK